MTMDFFQGENKELLSNMFSDIGDMGNYDDCKKLDFATYNIMQLNITNLPTEIRLGLCLPNN